jgi:hypothetical protein
VKSTRRMAVQVRCSGHACGNTKSWMVRIIPKKGSVAARVASPSRIRSEQPTSVTVAMVAASSGGRAGTRYSSRKSASVVSQPADELHQRQRHPLEPSAGPEKLGREARGGSLISHRLGRPGGARCAPQTEMR